MTDLDCNKYINCTVKKAISLRVGNPSVEFKSGCSVIDAVFPDGQLVEVKNLFNMVSVSNAELRRKTLRQFNNSTSCRNNQIGIF